MDIQEFAEYLKISPTTAYEILKGEEFSFVVQGYNRKVINRSLFEKWISEHTGPSGISGTDIETGGDEKHG